MKEVAPKAMDKCLARVRQTRTVHYVFGIESNEKLMVKVRVMISVLEKGRNVNSEEALTIERHPRCNVYDAESPADWDPVSGAHRSVPRDVIERRDQQSRCQRPRLHR